MRLPLSIFTAIFLAALCLAKPPQKPLNEAAPSWLDTIAPTVQIDPRTVYHKKVFYISLKSNEPGTIWIGLNRRDSLSVYRRPIAPVKDGSFIVYYYAEDMSGNRAPLDSFRYVLDMRAPELTVKPNSGRFRSSVTVRAFSNEPCRFFYHGAQDTTGIAFTDSFRVEDAFRGYVSATDSAGNSTKSPALSYVIDTSVVHVKIFPPPGAYNVPQEIVFTIEPAGDIYYSFDPVRPPQWFDKYEKPALLPFGLTVVRYYGKDGYGWESEVLQASYMIDTVPPKVKIDHKTGSAFDTLFVSTKEKAVIRYTINNLGFTDESPACSTGVIVVPRKGKADIRIQAQDIAGNYSDVVIFEQKYDFAAPVLTLSAAAGIYNHPISLLIRANEPADIFYTVDGTKPTERSFMFLDSIVISKEGLTILRYMGFDEAGNASEAYSAEFTLDTRPPLVKEKIEADMAEGAFLVALQADEAATIYYEIGDREPSSSSPAHKEKIRMNPNEVLRYFAVDRAGNRSRTMVMDELKKAMVAVSPPGGLFRMRVPLTFTTTHSASVSYRILPDTVWQPYSDTVRLVREGTYTVEYFCETRAGLRSPIRRAEFVIDLSAPEIDIATRKGANDSVIVFFGSNENATIYYTLDGTSPKFGSTIRTAGNKFLSSSDRITLYKPLDVKLSYYAEDAAGNESRISVIDVTKPRVIPSIPSGPERVYNQVLSITMNSFEKSQIFFSRHGNIPTADSTLFTGPITLAQSDTIIAFAIDISGFKGQLDTFIYRIDLPPSPQFTVRPDSAVAGAALFFDASGTVDHETPLSQLLYRWDFDGDSAFDTKEIREPKVSHVFWKPGIYRPVLEATDGRGQKQTASATIVVRSPCPTDMASVTTAQNRTFCVDRYEYPGRKGKPPKPNVTWVEAKMLCRESGKRLCTEEEWTTACQGLYSRAYPYGSMYESGKCNTENGSLSGSGEFSECGGDFGVYDMVGNVWEWTETKRDGYPQVMGGTFKSGRIAHCRHTSLGTVGSKYNDVGFRCCK